MWNRMRLSGGSGTQASQAPLGQTFTGYELIVSVASPVPTDPSRKLESFAPTTASDLGYTTRIWRGPRTCGTTGSARAVTAPAVSRPGPPGRMSTSGSVGDGELERAQAANPASRGSAARPQIEPMAARYLVTITYATRTLTLPAPLSRFGTLRHQSELWGASPE